MKVLFFAVFLSACYSVGKPRNFYIQAEKNRTGALNNSLSENGCFYFFTEKSIENRTLYRFGYFFFYENKICRSGVVQRETPFPKSKDSVISHITRDFAFHDKYKSSPDFGTFQVEGDKITIQVIKYVPQLTWQAATYSCSIANNTTINISACELRDKPDYCDENMTLHFLEMEKPDSLVSNRWKNKNWYWAN